MDENSDKTFPNSENFAESLLDLEMGLEKSCTIESIRELVHLYSRAIEYYESIKDNKYKAYHGRLKSLLLQEPVQKVLNASSKPFNRRPLTSIQLNHLKNSESSSNLPSEVQEEEKNPFERCESDQNIAPSNQSNWKGNKNLCLKNAEMQIKDNFSESHNSTQHVLVNIRGQEKGIEDKIKARKSLRRNTISGRPDGDKSAGRDRYQDGLIELMEKYMDEKMNQVSAIRRKYNTQMQEILEMGNSPIILEIVKQMDVSMNEEIQNFCFELEQKKLEEIARIRQVYIH